MADFTIASKVEGPKIDPLAIVGNVNKVRAGQIAVQQGMLKNKLLDQQVKSKIALGQAITGAMGEDGKVDWDKAGTSLGKNPDGSFAMPEFVAASQARRLADLGLTKEQLEVSKQKLSAVGDLTLGLLAQSKKVPLTPENINNAIQSQLVSAGILGPDDGPMVAGVLGQLTDDPTQNMMVLQRLYSQTHPTVEGINTLLGTPTINDTGGGLTVSRTSPVSGDTTVTGVIDKGLSPSEAQTPAYTYTDKDGVQHIVTKAEAAHAAVKGETPAGIKSGLPIGSQETAAAAVQQATQLQQRASIVPQRRAALKNAEDVLDNFQPGPKADLTYTLGAIATQFGKPPPSVTKGVAAQEEFNKLAAQIALDQWGSLGGTGSNEQLATAMKANPNAAMSKMGIKNVVALLQGNEDAIGAQFEAWKKFSGVHGPASYGDFLAGWNRYYDPRVFQAEHMSPAAVKTMVSKMSDAEKKTFARDKSIAQQAGWLGE